VVRPTGRNQATDPPRGLDPGLPVKIGSNDTAGMHIRRRLAGNGCYASAKPEQRKAVSRSPGVLVWAPTPDDARFVTIVPTGWKPPMTGEKFRALHIAFLKSLIADPEVGELEWVRECCSTAAPGHYLGPQPAEPCFVEALFCHNYADMESLRSWLAEADDLIARNPSLGATLATAEQRDLLADRNSMVQWFEILVA